MKVLLSESEVREGVRRMAADIARHYQGVPLTILAIMTGSVVLLADLIRLLDLPLRVGVLQASSYRSGMTRGELTINYELMPDIAGREVLLVDDIFDTGHTLDRIVKLVAEMGASEVRTAVLLRKHRRAQVDLCPDFVAFDIPDEFVVGFGLDYHDMFRNLPYVASLSTGDVEGIPR